MASIDPSSDTSDPRFLVNPWWLDIPLDPLAGLGDADEEAQLPYAHLDPNNESVMRGLIRQYFVPYLQRIDAESISRLKRAYRYYLTFEKFPWGPCVFDASYMPFEHPDNPRDFFLWIWEECFPGEDWHLKYINQYVVVDDIDEPNRTMKLSPQ